MRGIVYCFYYISHTYSGQSKASDIMVDELQKLGWDSRVVRIHGLDNSKSLPLISGFLLLPGLLWSMVRALLITLQNAPRVHFNMSQGFNAFARYAPPLFIIRTLRPSARIAISLHGNLFMTWADNELNTKIFTRILKAADLVTVLGEKQKEKLVSWGVAEDRCKVLPNPCDIEPISNPALLDKHLNADEIIVLHLSTLIKSKGYLDFLHSAPETTRLAGGRRLKFVVCGPVAREADEANSVEELTRELENSISKLNSLSPALNAEWIPGLAGAEKSELFYSSHIFVFPSKYSVEAQPLVLLEAMATGASIVTTDIGEIPEALSGADAVILSKPTISDIANATAGLVLDSDHRLESALANKDFAEKKYSSRAYGKFWSAYFGAS